MRKLIKVLMTGLFSAILLMTGTVCADTKAVSIEIPVESSAACVVKITGDRNTPLPEETVLRFNEHGTRKYEITYNTPGTYKYQIQQIEMTDSKIVYDKSVYNSIVFVGVSDNGELFVEQVIHKEGSDEKSASAFFKNEAVKPESNTPRNPSGTTPTGVGFDWGYAAAGGSALLLLLFLIFKTTNKEQKD